MPIVTSGASGDCFLFNGRVDEDVAEPILPRGRILVSRLYVVQVEPLSGNSHHPSLMRHHVVSQERVRRPDSSVELIQAQLSLLRLHPLLPPRVNSLAVIR